MEVLLGFSFLVFLLFSFTKLLLKIHSKDSVGIKEEELSLPYIKKQYFFSRSEQEFFNILNSKIDAHQHTIFCKVRLEDFIDVEYRARSERIWRNKIRAKHIDFLIWDLVKKEIVMAIELDGKSHNSYAMNVRDDFVNSLYKKVGIRLERVALGSNFDEEITAILSK